MPDHALQAFQSGVFTGAGLIMAIGAQNTFVLSQGLRKQHAATIAAICAGIDLLLITVGVLGMGLVIQSNPFLMKVALWGGALFLFAYGLRALIAAIRPGSLAYDDGLVISLRSAVLTALAVSLLNPHVYLDTVVLLGSIGGQFDAPDRIAFIAGAGLASVLWFFSLALGAQALAPIFSKPSAWRILDVIVCLFMWSVAWRLVSEGLSP